VIVRAAFTFRGMCAIDPCIKWRDEIAKAGLAFGAYMILGWNVDPVAQARKFAEAYGKALPGDLPVWLDVEFPGARGRVDTGLTAREALTRVQQAEAVLHETYETVGIYTSARVWHEDLDGLGDDTIGKRCPLWIKVPYPYKTRQPAHLEARGAIADLPAPWRSAESAGSWLKQFQGDAIGVPGFSGTVDLSEFLAFDANAPESPRSPWIVDRLTSHSAIVSSDFPATIRSFQQTNGLDADGVIGLKTFAALCH